MFLSDFVWNSGTVIFVVFMSIIVLVLLVLIGTSIFIKIQKNKIEKNIEETKVIEQKNKEENISHKNSNNISKYEIQLELKKREIEKLLDEINKEKNK